MRRGALALLLGLLLAAPASADAPFDPFSAAAVEAKLGASVPQDDPFTDAAGTRVTLADYLGEKPLILTPVDLDCGNICGITLGMLFSALDAMSLPPGSYEVVAFSIDPREGPAAAERARAEHLERFEQLGAGGAVQFLVDRTGESAARLAEAIGFAYEYDETSDQYAHPAAVAVLTPEGRLARWLYGFPFQPSDVRLALTEASNGAIGTLADRLWLLCYGYDPETGRYTGTVMTALQAGGGLTVLALGGLIALMLHRERRQRRRAR